MYLPEEFLCTLHLQPFQLASDDHVENTGQLVCAQGCQAPVVAGIPRFVNATNYAAGFGLQWKAFQRTQLDSYTLTTISRDRLTRCLGGSLDILQGKSVLEVGCGAGRFTELMLDAGARVFATDLSAAVEANYENCHGWPNYFCCQADARRLPVAPYSFDFVVCLGVIQHTPDPEETIRALAGYLKPGGFLFIDHYAPNYALTRSRVILRQLLLKLNPRISYWAALAVSRTLLPLHKLTWNKGRGRWRLRPYLQRFSPLVDYYDIYPQLGEKLLSEWALLDTHDTLTDHYKHLRSAEQVERCLQGCGLIELVVGYGGNGVEARARQPFTAEARSSA